MSSRQRDDKCRSMPWLAECSDLPRVTFDDSAADRQPDPTPFILIATNQTLEGLKDALCILLVKANAVVLYLDGIKGLLQLFGRQA